MPRTMPELERYVKCIIAFFVPIGGSAIFRMKPGDLSKMRRSAANAGCRNRPSRSSVAGGFGARSGARRRAPGQSAHAGHGGHFPR